MIESPSQSDWRRCPGCRRTLESCLCKHLPNLTPPAKVVLLQHPREARNPLGTARLAHLALEGSELFVSYRFDLEPWLLARIEQALPNAGILFPSEGARPIAELARGATGSSPLTLFALDGTWSQAKKMWARTPALHRLPAFRIDGAPPSAYVIRKEPAAHCLSTFEAVMVALDAIAGDGEGRFHASTQEPMRALAEQQLRHSLSDERSPRWRVRGRQSGEA